ncbi:MAG: BACON domain-containing protein [Vicinamibacterales bacterium]
MTLTLTFTFKQTFTGLKFVNMRAWDRASEFDWAIPGTWTVGTTSVCQPIFGKFWQSVGSGSQTGEVNVIAGPGCRWTASSTSDWLSITSNSAGVGTGALTYSIAPNTSAPRRGLISIGEISLVIMQAGRESTSIEVTTNLAAASFSISGPANSTGRGTSFVTEASSGTYGISFTPLAGYSTPTPATKVLAAGQVVSFQGNYDSPILRAAIDDLGVFVDRCPATDLAYTRIRADFRIRKDGALLGEIGCKEPYSSNESSHELLVLQILRFIYYMDLGRSAYLPWTDARLYDWMRTKIAGFNIDSTARLSYCCQFINNELFVVVAGQSPRSFRSRRDVILALLSGTAFFAHETRHLDGPGHTSCCGIPGGCDQRYDETNLSSYGVERFLFGQWLNGGINIGLSCLFDRTSMREIGDYLVVSGAYDRFCEMRPARLTLPEFPGGVCSASRAGPTQER